ncbi:hypothetical protein [Sphaerisporangium fuscum]|uniref:hypothetical protein n=1 Tax=Sphaerisporangium fuscum TaxID=2835868 RepID=UPI001BDC7038|nr:hypothetical protein [Sphaerisporangium fuscum]
MARRLTLAADALQIPMPGRESLVRSIKNWEAGKHRPRDPYPLLYAHAFGADESGLFRQTSLWPQQDAERLDEAARAPRRLDLGVLDSLAHVLAAQRRTEDLVGSAPLLGVVTAQLTVVERLVIDSRGPFRRPMLDMASQWSQFAGWLHANSSRPVDANRYYDRALEWSTETDDRNMIATILSMKGYLGWLSGRVEPMIGLSQAAQRERTVSPGVRALGAQQEARGHALTGDGEATDRKLDEALELAQAAGEHPEEEPPWIYFYDSDYLLMQRGLAYRLLGRHSAAIELIQQGLAALPVEVRRSEWAAQYLLHSAEAHAAMADITQARAVAADVAEIARATDSTRLQRRLRRFEAQLQ